MLLEEWRLQSSVFGGRRFAFFPVLVFLLSLGFSVAALRFSTLAGAALADGMNFLSVFLGLGAGAAALSSSDALENVLGPTNFLVYSSRTLPISRRRLFAYFIVSDLLYYTALFLVPLGTGLAAAGVLTPRLLLMPVFFGAGAVVSSVFAVSSLRSPGTPVSYGVTGRTMEDVSLVSLGRAAGGILKPVFSMGVVAGLFVGLTSYFPAAEVFLKNPSLSFSALAGITSLSVYNWLNRFDDPEDYAYLPVSQSQLIEAKQRAYTVVAGPLTLVFLVPFLAVSSPSSWVLSLVTAASTVTLTMGAASLITGLKPNSRLYDSAIFLKYLVLNSLFVVPLLALSVFYTPQLLVLVLALSGITAAAGLLAARRAR